MMMIILERLQNPLNSSKHGRLCAGTVCIELLSILSYDIRPLKSVDRPRAEHIFIQFLSLLTEGGNKFHYTNYLMVLHKKLV